MLALFAAEVVDVDAVDAVGEVGVADQRPGAVGDESRVVAPGDGDEVGGVVGATPGTGAQVMDLEAPGDVAGVGAAAVPVAEQHRPHDLG